MALKLGIKRGNNCPKFLPNIFNPSKCSQCFSTKDEHYLVDGLGGSSSTGALASSNTTNTTSSYYEQKSMDAKGSGAIGQSHHIQQSQKFGLKSFDNALMASNSSTMAGWLFIAPLGWRPETANEYRTKKWQRRWFVLHNYNLSYSLDPDPEGLPQGEFDLNQCQLIPGNEDLEFDQEHYSVFGLSNKLDKSLIYLRASSESEYRNWLRVLKKSMQITSNNSEIGIDHSRMHEQPRGDPDGCGSTSVSDLRNPSKEDVAVLKISSPMESSAITVELRKNPSVSTIATAEARKSASNIESNTSDYVKNLLSKSASENRNLMKSTSLVQEPIIAIKRISRPISEPIMGVRDDKEPRAVKEEQQREPMESREARREPIRSREALPQEPIRIRENRREPVALTTRQERELQVTRQVSQELTPVRQVSREPLRRTSTTPTATGQAMKRIQSEPEPALQTNESIPEPLTRTKRSLRQESIDTDTVDSAGPIRTSQGLEGPIRTRRALQEPIERDQAGTEPIRTKRAVPQEPIRSREAEKQESIKHTSTSSVNTPIPSPRSSSSSQNKPKIISTILKSPPPKAQEIESIDSKPLQIEEDETDNHEIQSVVPQPQSQSLHELLLLQENELLSTRLNDLTEKLYNSEKNLRLVRGRLARVKNNSLKEKELSGDIYNKINELEIRLGLAKSQDGNDQKAGSVAGSEWYRCTNCSRLETELTDANAKLADANHQVSALKANVKELNINLENAASDLEDIKASTTRLLSLSESNYKTLLNNQNSSHQLALIDSEIRHEYELAEETRATLAAIEALKRNHEIELKHEINKFKLEWSGRVGGYEEKNQALVAQTEELLAELNELNFKYLSKCEELRELKSSKNNK